MSESLIIDDPNEYIHLHLISKYPRVHGLIPIVVIPLCKELVAEVLHCIIIFELLKSFSFFEFTFEGSGLTSQTFDQHTNSHT